MMVCFNLFLLFGFAQKLPEEGGQGGWKKLFLSCSSYPAARHSVNPADEGKFSLPGRQFEGYKTLMELLDGKEWLNLNITVIARATSIRNCFQALPPVA